MLVIIAVGDMRLDDTLELYTVESDYDSNLNAVESVKVVNIGKCKILPNSKAVKTRGNDGSEFVYSFEIFVRNPKQIVVEGDKIHFRKKDGTIDRTMTVQGFVTLRKWERLWV